MVLARLHFWLKKSLLCVCVYSRAIPRDSLVLFPSACACACVRCAVPCRVVPCRAQPELKSQWEGLFAHWHSFVAGLVQARAELSLRRRQEEIRRKQAVSKQVRGLKKKIGEFYLFPFLVSSIN